MGYPKAVHLLKKHLEDMGFVENGKLTPKGARKAARMVSFCDAFSIPVVTLVDSVGVDNGSPREPAPVFGKLAKAYATATTAKISVVVGNAYGAAFTLLGSRALGADLDAGFRSAAVNRKTGNRQNLGSACSCP